MAEFDQYAEEYNRVLEQSLSNSGEGVEYFADYKVRYLAERVVTHDDVRILDFGCGVGNVSKALQKALPNAVLHGYDPSPDSLARADPALGDRVALTSSLDELEPGFDVIFMANVMHHIPPNNRARILRKIHALLGRDGRLVIFEHNPLNPLTRRVVDNCIFDADAVLLKSTEAIQLTAEAGMRLVSRQFIVFFPKFLGFLRPLEGLLGWCPIGAQYVVVGQKRAD